MFHPSPCARRPLVPDNGLSLRIDTSWLLGENLFMTLSESILWSFSRSLLIATVAIGPLAVLLRQIESCESLRSRRLWLVAAILPLFVPELLIGFNYRLTASQLSAGSPAVIAASGTELLYGLIQIGRCLAIGCAVSMLLPESPVSCESLHSWRMLRASTPSLRWRVGWWRLQLIGPKFRLLVSWSLMALIVFQEFETAALMQIDRHPIAWTVWLFDAHAAYQPLWRSLQMTLLPLCCELLLLGPAFWLLTTQRAVPDTSAGQPLLILESTTSAKVAAWMCLIPSLLFFVIWPIAANAATAISGLLAMARNSFLLRQSFSEILTSTGFALAAAVLAMTISSLLLERRGMGKATVVRRCFFLIPGLLGSLVLSLLLLAMFQTPPLRFLYDTWLPMLLGLFLAVLPKAFAVVLLLKRSSDQSSVYSAELLASSSTPGTRTRAATILWRLQTARWLLGGLVVAHWCFWDVTVASILHSVRLEPVITRLYNEMHYGRTEALMSLSFVAACMPGLVWLLAMGSSWLVARGRSRNHGSAGTRAASSSRGQGR